jgi:S-adenosylmethionine-diacylglycerol 3-amino-3-carboxypropyl transferase
MQTTAQNQSTRRLKAAIEARDGTAFERALDRLFTFAFKGLVYPQIWEDPEIDLEALDLRPASRMVAIASGGCNILSYLIAGPRQITAVDLNRAHVALTRLKLASARHMPSHSSFYRFFGEADEKANITAYRRFVRDHLDPETRRYWEGRDLSGRRRITLFSRDLYHHGLLGYFIGLSHLIARCYGVDPRDIIHSRSLEEQRNFYETRLAPLFDKRLISWATSKKVSLYGLGIPPAQYEALASSGSGDMSSVLKQRLEKLVCGFSLNENYFAWQAFDRGYSSGDAGPLPPYLRADHFDTIKERADRLSVVNRSFTEHLEAEADGTLDAYVLLDAQDWMTDVQLNELWSPVTRTARPGARAIFRTAAEPSLLPGRVSEDILARWTYHAERSAELTSRDRSAIYGGFHLYRFDG